MSILKFVSTDAQLSMPVATYEALLETAASDERKRIIRLLEQHVGFGDPEWDENVMAVLALIEEEK